MKYQNPITLTPRSTVEVSAFISLADIAALTPICETGIPEDMTDEMRDVLQTLVCQCVNPYRYIQEVNKCTD
jgi:hypothetical protein